MFTKSRFGGALAALAKPNLSTARPRKATETHVTDPTEASTGTYPTERSFSTALSAAVSAAQPQTASVPVLSPGAMSATVSLSHLIFHFILCRASAVFVPVLRLLMLCCC